MGSRTSERHGLDVPTRFLLAERDLDEHEEEIDAIRAANSKILWALVGILISTTTASILLALNLAVGP